MLLVATIGSGLCLHFAACHCAAAAAVVMSRLSLATFGACYCYCGPAEYRLLQPAYVYVMGLARHTIPLPHMNNVELGLLLAISVVC